MKQKELTLTGMTHLVTNLMATVVVSMMVWSPVELNAQDSIYLKEGGARSRRTGKIFSMTPDKITIRNGAKSEDISAGNIRKIVYGGESKALDRARDRFESGRFDECLAELQKINSQPSSDFIEQEIDYLRAFANAEICLKGGNITAQVAGNQVKGFIDRHGKSYRIYPATRLLGKLLLAVDRADLAEAQFTKLSQSNWPEYKVAGLFDLGQAQLLTGKNAEAIESFVAIGAVKSNDPVIIEYKLLSDCMLAKAEALNGDTVAAQKKLEAIIKREDPRVASLLFAHAYNGIGICHEKSENWEEAAIAYLHTELLFSGHPDPHAESLFRISRVWTKLEEADRASKARSTLQTRYPNSYWYQQLVNRDKQN